MDKIHIRGARQHNLKNIDLDLPRNRLIVITGVSGSGKSSLAFDTLFAEGQRRYLEALSSRSRLYLQALDKPDVDSIQGLSPAIAVEQKRVVRNPRSTVGTLSEIHDYLRVLYSHLGAPHCAHCGHPVVAHSVPEILEEMFTSWPESSRLLLLAPMGEIHEGRIGTLFAELRKEGFARARLDGTVLELDPPPLIPRRPRYTLDVVIDRVVLSRSKRQRLTEAVELALSIGKGFLNVTDTQDRTRTFSDSMCCPACKHRMTDVTPSLFSFHHPLGMCPDCKGMGSTADDPTEAMPATDAKVRTTSRAKDTSKIRGRKRSAKPDFENGTGPLPFAQAYERPCPTCRGSRYNLEARSVLLNGLGIHEVNCLPVSELLPWTQKLTMSEAGEKIARPLLMQIQHRAAAMLKLGLDYLTLGRSASTLSAGEAQRVRLAQQVGSQLTGILYVLDEPSIGLHPHDHRNLLDIVHSLREAGNTVVVVEHDRDTILQADHVVDMGPGAGSLGGNVIFSGTPKQLLAQRTSLTGQYLSGSKTIPIPLRRLAFQAGQLFIHGASGHNLNQIDVQIPLGCLTCVTGVSGSGKSTLILDTLHRALARRLYGAATLPEPFQSIEGLQAVKKVLLVDQSPIGNNPRSTPATSTGIFSHIRQLFAKLPEARARGYRADRFSYNVKGGRCETCKGEGVQTVDLVFLPDVTITCPSCRGRRFSPETLQVLFKGHSIAEVLAMSVNDAALLLENIPSIRRQLEVLRQVGLGYLSLGQSALTLSGGEAQRVKLAAELSLQSSEHTLFILDEPTTGLHFDDVLKLMNILQRLSEAGHTVVLIEHHLDVVKCADYVVDLGPGGGALGGNVVAAGTPEEIVRCDQSITGQYLRTVLR
jgi:excinuclease ABC subunit A